MGGCPMQIGAFTALAAVVRGGCASSSDQVHAAGIEATAPPNSRSHRSTADYYSILNRGVTQLSHNTPQCESACKKDPLFRVIGIQSGPRNRGQSQPTPRSPRASAPGERCSATAL
jgi:hypothetical protein